MSDPALIIAEATIQHHLDPADDSRCVCGFWGEGEACPGWDDHMADVAVEALSAAGWLAEPTGRGYEWGERDAAGDVTPTALSGLVDDDWRPLRRDRTATLVRRTMTMHGTTYGPWQFAPPTTTPESEQP